MKSNEINIEQAFDAIGNIVPSSNWDFVLEQKLNNSRTSKSIKITTINFAVLILVFINIGFIFNSYLNENSKQENSRKDDFKIIATELLGSNN